MYWCKPLMSLLSECKVINYSFKELLLWIHPLAFCSLTDIKLKCHLCSLQTCTWGFCDCSDLLEGFGDSANRARLYSYHISVTRHLYSKI